MPPNRDHGEVLGRLETKIDTLVESVGEIKSKIEQLTHNDSKQGAHLAVLESRVGNLEGVKKSVFRVVMGIFGALIVAAVSALVTIL